jgi:hypothetical protein
MLEVRSLTKYYEHTAAVRNVSFTRRYSPPWRLFWRESRLLYDDTPELAIHSLNLMR